MASKTQQSRNLIVLCDGTGNSAVRGAPTNSTNVSRLGHGLKASPSQIIHYQSGVGTGTIGDLYTSVAQGTGLGIDDNILDSYSFLANNYNPGDKIYIFGFSRGAFTARVLANLVVTLGIFVKKDMWMLKKAWSRYTENDNGVAFKDFVEKLWGNDWERTQRVTVKILGVWDTVGSVGMPDYQWVKTLGWNSDYSFYNTELKWGVENAFHALALDEKRAPFTPTLFYMPTESKPNHMPDINLKQCWFPGAHSDVGGSYPDCHIADISLFWMLQNCLPHGLLFDQEYLDMRIRLNHNPDQVNSALRKEIAKNYPGYGCGKTEDSFWSGAMPILGWAYRTPGEYHDEKNKGETKEAMHQCVRLRKDGMGSKWAPKSMDGWKPEKRGDKWVWVKVAKTGWGWSNSKDNKKVEIPEEPLLEDKSDLEGQLKAWTKTEPPARKKDGRNHWYLSDNYKWPGKK